MKIAVLGTGMVGNAIAGKLAQIGHAVVVGSRTAKEHIRTFADAAAFGDIVFDCTNGANAIAALRLAGAENLRGKILIQVGNPLDTSQGMPPTLTVCNTDSLGEQTQREFPDVRVVKALKRAGRCWGLRINSGTMAWIISLPLEPGEAPVCVSNFSSSCAAMTVRKRLSPM